MTLTELRDKVAEWSDARKASLRTNVFPVGNADCLSAIDRLAKAEWDLQHALDALMAEGK